MGHFESQTAFGVTKKGFNVGHVRISDLTFIHCCDNGIESVNQLTITHSTFVGKHNGGNSVMIVGTNARMDATFFLSNGVGRYQPDIPFKRYLQMTLNIFWC